MLSAGIFGASSWVANEEPNRKCTKIVTEFTFHAKVIGIDDIDGTERERVLTCLWLCCYSLFSFHFHSHANSVSFPLNDDHSSLSIKKKTSKIWFQIDCWNSNKTFPLKCQFLFARNYRWFGIRIRQRSPAKKTNIFWFWFSPFKSQTPANSIDLCRMGKESKTHKKQ